MFDGAGAESLCCRDGIQAGYALSSGASANLAPVVRNVSTLGRRTITARDVAFPLSDPYSPVTRTRAPVPGLNAWPGRANRLGRRYYGLEAADQEAKERAAAAAVKRPGFSGMGSLFTNAYTTDPRTGAVDWLSEIGPPPPIYGPAPSRSGGIDWNNVFNGIFRTLPPTVSAITGHYDPLNRTPQQIAEQQQFSNQYGVPPEGYHYNSSGQLVRDAVSSVTNFITENPLLVGGAVLGVVLLFMKSPSRR